MLIQGALLPTGKAVDHRKDVMYAKLNETGVLCWYDVEDGRYINPVGLVSIGDDKWKPHHEVKEIRAEKAGELWGHISGDLWATRPSGTIGGIDIDCVSKWGTEWSRYGKYEWHNKIIHNKDGWTRLFPSVEDDSIERIEIEVRPGWHNAGREGVLLGRVFTDRQWAIVLWNDEEDPDLFKMEGISIL